MTEFVYAPVRQRGPDAYAYVRLVLPAPVRVEAVGRTFLTVPGDTLGALGHVRVPLHGQGRRF
ncbi:hypothetical protein [Streptomyces malaysiensis]|uniref:Uncharacterized protein n=1 Tax=Streptomyces malaysiensis subsp. samsunensis TaxID=459658 RepID=A0A9X2RXB5_STRMQ|nr:hypothetical protein [Streptomyces samsunensis]MCQ8832125.1 hypothetical protein [Streptomyces samsunensis]